MVKGELGEENTYFGTGFLISGRIVLTAAHNIYDRDSEKEATKLIFVPGINGKQGKEYKVLKYHYPEEYKMKEERKDAWEYDYGVLELEEDLGN